METTKNSKINFHYIDKCDCKCLFCFAGKGKKTDENKVINTFKSLTKVTNKINLVGGEIFLELELLCKLIEIGIKNNVEMSLVTNGLILSENLTDNKIIYILKNIVVLGISVDSLNDNTNKKSGRVNNDKTLTFENIKNIKEVCLKYNTLLKINTVVTKLNLNEVIKNEIKELNPCKWKIFQVVSKDEKFEISKKEMEKYCENNKLENIITKIEYQEEMKISYIMFDRDGLFYANEKKYKDININEIVCKYSKPAEYLALKLKDTLFEVEFYNKRY